MAARFRQHYLRILLWTGGVLGIGLVGFGWWSTRPTPPPPPIYARASDALFGDRRLIVRLPRPTTGYQEQIVVWLPPFSTAYAIRRESVHDIHIATAMVDLTPQQQHAVDHFRQTWCQQLPSVRQPTPNEPFYDVAVWCDTPPGQSLQIPVTTLPADLAALLDQLGQPHTCNRSRGG
jgi:hypothetical protein